MSTKAKKKAAAPAKAPKAAKAPAKAAAEKTPAKAKKEAAPAAKAKATEKPAKAEKPGKKESAPGKGSKKEQEVVEQIDATAARTSEDGEDGEDADMEEGGATTNVNAAALAAAGTSEMSASFKNFRQHPDMENFYRFIFENDLRLEALEILDRIITDKQAKKAGKPAVK
jgi:hypothetical protein